MSLKRILRFFVCGTLLMCMTALLNLKTFLPSLSPFKDDDLNSKGNGEKLSGLRILEPSEFDSNQSEFGSNQSDVQCVNATVGALHFPMCIYDPEDDRHISKLVAAGKYFEQDRVKKWLDLFRIHPDVAFVDLGANIGTYSLPIAHSGIDVVSVEPNTDSARRLAKSAHLGRLKNNMDVLNYALSSEESTTTFLEPSPENPGRTVMVGNASCLKCLSANVTVLNKLIPFIRRKKAFMKIDVEGSEVEIFQRKSAANFFDEIDVLMIQMEWVFITTFKSQEPDGKRRVDRLLEFFYQRGYDVYDVRTEQKLDADWRKWPEDVIFKKDNLPKSQLFLI